jgi:hypothetical protein
MSEDDPDLKSKIKEILVELQDQSFKNDVLDQLKEASRKKPLQHPAFLLILGFFLTGVVGTFLTARWQSREQERQQKQIAHQRAIQQKYDIADQINKAVSETYTAAQVISNLISDQKISKNDKQASERETFWNSANRNWIPNSLLLQQRVVINFNDATAIADYKEIVTDTENMSSYINESLAAVKETNWKALKKKERDDTSKQITDRRTRILDFADKIRDKSEQLLRRLADDAHKDEQAGIEASRATWTGWLPL